MSAVAKSRPILLAIIKEVPIVVQEQCRDLVARRLSRFEQWTVREVGYSGSTVAAHVSPASFTADLSGCAALSALAADEIADLFIAALGRAGATIVDTVSHAFPAAGLTCVVILRESHAVLHTWPETGMVNIDIFSSSSRLQSLDAIGALKVSLGAGTMLVQEIPRAAGHSSHSDPRR